MSATPNISPSDAKLPCGEWPNPRWRMSDIDQIAARVGEDGRRIAAEKGDCTTEDLTRLGWYPEQVKAAQARIRAQCDALDADLARANATAADMRADHATLPIGDIDFVEAEVVQLAPPVREPILSDMDIAFGCERAA
jgi:hypothetical protein